MKTTLIFLLLALGGLTQCTKDNTGATYTPNCAGGTKSYKNNVAPLLQTYCAGCHSNFSTYSQVNYDKNSLRSRVADGSMPRGASMSDAQKDIILCWIDNGAINN